MHAEDAKEAVEVRRDANDVSDIGAVIPSTRVMIYTRASRCVEVIYIEQSSRDDKILA